MSAATSVQQFFETILTKVQPTQGDILWATARQARRIQERTVSGLDINQSAFAPYSVAKPFYHTPRTDGSLRSRREASLHHARFYGAHRARGSVSVRYESYATFKASRGVLQPDLGGMEGRLLSNMEISVDGNTYSLDAAERIGLNESVAPGSIGGIGIYGEEAAKIGLAHNTGVPSRNLPQRHWMGISDGDLAMISEDIKTRVMERKMTQGATMATVTA